MTTMNEGRQMSSTARQLPQYQCHKKVWALKIKSIRQAEAPTIAELEAILNGGSNATNADVVGAWLTPEDPGFAEFPVSRDFVLKHEPVAGGYWVQYDNTYQSFSPADAFESGYTIINHSKPAEGEAYS